MPNKKAGLPTPEQIDEEIEKLKALYVQVRPTTLFNESNLDAIEAQVKVLRDDLSESEIYALYEPDDDDEPRYVLDNALDAHNWVNSPVGDYELPSEGWTELVMPGGNGVKLVSSDMALKSAQQHLKPCSDCPMRRDSLPGWLGTATPEQWADMCHSDTLVECHTRGACQCAGVAIYRKNVHFIPVRVPLLPVERDTQTVFSNRSELLAHHLLTKPSEDEPH